MGFWAKAAGVLASALLTGLPIFAEGPCAKKRVDACGCHHVYGVRHCHPNRRTKFCEAPASGHLKLKVAPEKTEAF